MITQDLLEELRCPYCGSRVECETQFSFGRADASYGIVRCACYRYPIIEGILVLKQLSGPADTRDRRVEYLEAGDPQGALYHALHETSPISALQSPIQPNHTFLRRLHEILSPKLRQHAGPQISNDVGDGSLTFREMLLRLRPPHYADYLFQRYANNSFLAAIPLILLLKELKWQGGIHSAHASRIPRVLDIACGVGHASFLMKSLFPYLSIVAADHDFVNLYLARRYLVPTVTCVCLDAEIPLPFADKSFDAVFCLDGFHYIRSKVALLSEFDRVLHQLGLWLFPHLHNASAHNVSPGIPLGYEDYARCFAVVPRRMFSEAKLLQKFMLDQTLDLSVVATPEEVDRSNVFTLVASRRSDLWRRHENITSLLWKDKAPLCINPIYKASKQRESIRLVMEWPNAALEAECAAIKEYLPQEAQIDRLLWERLQTGSVSVADEPAVQALINSFMLVRLPREYRRSV